MTGHPRRSLPAAMAALLLWLVAVVGAFAPAAAANDERAQRGDIFISTDSQFNPANGVRSGSGTKGDPYVISGWDVGSVVIKDTSKHLLIKDNAIDRLVLDWNGPGVTVVNNEVGDLRVNQNVPRTGEATSGLIARNRFGTVGQLRHFDGVFEHNLVKREGVSPFDLFDSRAVNFDGFHGARFRNNTIFGYMDVKLHGHHHGSSFEADSHYHASSHEHEGHGGHGQKVDHTQRYHEVFVTNNKITATGPYALGFNDRGHSANDRTNASETDPALNANHTHFTQVHLVGNTLSGAGLHVDVFNADDERHTGTRRGLLEIRGNRIALERTSDDFPWSSKDGIAVSTATDVEVSIVDNVVVGEAADERDVLDERFAADAGILLAGVDLANVLLQDNRVANMLYGIRASNMTKSAFWTIRTLDTNGVTHEVYWDDSVKNPPRRSP
jgi:hypothetical protein